VSARLPEIPPPLIEQVLGPARPGLPIVLCGGSGSGRTVLCLQQVHAALARGEAAALLTAEPPRLLLQQAESMGLPLESALEDGRLRLLELEPDAPSSLRAHGGAALAHALCEAAPESRFVVIDPLTVLTVELLDEGEMRAALRGLFDGLAAAGWSALLTAELEAVEESPALGRALRDSCGVFAETTIETEGHGLHVAKSRTGISAETRVRFHVGVGGPVVADPEADPDLGAVTASPAPAAPKAPEIASGTQAESTARPRVLLVEDEKLTRNMLQEWLERDYEVEVAEDGFEAISAVLQRRPDLVVLDLHLPRADGFEVLRALRGAGVMLPVLVVSATLARASDRIRSLVLGATDLMPKPIQRFELLHRAETLLRLAPADSDVPDLPDAADLLDPEGGRRLLEDEDFRERLQRACRFGEQFDLPSSLVAVEAPSTDALDLLIGGAERRLRPEDAALQVSKTRLLLMLVACGGEQVPAVLRRLASDLEDAESGPGRLQLRVWDAAPTADTDWARYFEGMTGWP